MKWLLLSVIAASLIAACSDDPTSSSKPGETQEFYPYGYDCSAGQADTYCRSVGYEKAVSFTCEQQSGYCWPGYPCYWEGLGCVTCWRERQVSDTADTAQ